MSLFSEVKPQWDNVGTDPGGTKKTAGWLANEKPPAEWFNWLFNRNYKCIDELRTVVDAIAVASGAANVINYGSSSTGNDTYVIAPTPAIAGYAAGQVFEILVDVGNTGTASVNVSAKGAKTIKKITAAGKVALDTGDMIANGNYICVYDGTDMILQNPTSILSNIVKGSSYQGVRMKNDETGTEFGNVMIGQTVMYGAGTHDFVAPKTGEYFIELTAGGGGGSSSSPRASGGGGGGWSGWTTLTKGTTYQLVVGAGGALGALTGDTGGSTSFNGNTATGGTGADSGGNGGTGGSGTHKGANGYTYAMIYGGAYAIVAGGDSRSAFNRTYGQGAAPQGAGTGGCAVIHW